MPLHFHAASDIGRYRSENQDRWLVRDDLQLAAVADGMGGLPCGSEAASCAIAHLEAQLAICVPKDLDGWRTLLDSLNRDVHALGRRLSPDLGLGTTLTCICGQSDRLILAHVGDSAALRLRDGNLEQLTREHTVAAEITERRASGLVERMPHSAEHILTSCLGLSSLPHKDVFETEIKRGDRLLVCSDGLTKAVDRLAICATLAEDARLEEIAAQLTVLALRAGGTDNCTVIVGQSTAD